MAHLVGPENYDISTRRLKGDCSSSELQTHELEPTAGDDPALPEYKTGVLPITLRGQMVPSPRDQTRFSALRVRRINRQCFDGELVDAESFEISTRSLRGNRSASELHVQLVLQRGIEPRLPPYQGGVTTTGR